jgi:hypothetical protein
LIIWYHAAEREEHTDGLRVCGNKALRIFEPVREKIIRWTILDNEDVCKCLLFTIERRKAESRRLRLEEYAGWHDKSLHNFRRKARRERLLGRPRSKWDYIIKI